MNDQAAAWLARLRSDELTPQDRIAFDRWLDLPQNAVAYARVEATWERAERLQATPHAIIATATPNPKAQWTRRAAAIGVVALGGAAGWRWFGAPEVFETALGERKRATLADGSIVELNTGSRLQVDFTTRRRAVRLLKGEALFEVAKDPARPFVVSAGEAQFRAIGTAFNVRLREHLVEMTVTEGVVQVVGARANVTANPGRARSVAAGRAAVVGPGAIAEMPLNPEALQRRVAWRDGVIELRGETLEQAVAEFNRYRTAKLVVGDPNLAGLRVGGTFGTDEAEKFVGALRSGFNVRTVQGEGGTTYLLPAA
ncbi:MAG: FecR domain-containing protein [Alphaproteobacteria bacterium]|nr:FecR domain-containing protein [Alphaproteobacteria bacterium]